MTMGMHTEGCAGAPSSASSISPRRRSASSIPTRWMSISTSAPRSTPRASTPRQINRKLRELMKRGYGTIVLKNPGAKHSLAVGILNRLNLYIEGSLRLFRLRPARRAECAASRAASAGPAARTCWPAPSSSRRMPARTSAPAMRGGDLVCKGIGRLAHRHRPEGRHDHRRRRHRLVLRLHDAARPHGRFCGNAGKNLGDSMYDGTIYVGGEIAQPRRRCGPAPR